jgi:hypothetical protein
LGVTPVTSSRSGHVLRCARTVLAEVTKLRTPPGCGNTHEQRVRRPIFASARSNQARRLTRGCSGHEPLLYCAPRALPSRARFVPLKRKDVSLKTLPGERATVGRQTTMNRVLPKEACSSGGPRSRPHHRVDSLEPVHGDRVSLVRAVLGRTRVGRNDSSEVTFDAWCRPHSTA